MMPEWIDIRVKLVVNGVSQPKRRTRTRMSRRTEARQPPHNLRSRMKCQDDVKRTAGGGNSLASGARSEQRSLTSPARILTHKTLRFSWQSFLDADLPDRNTLLVMYCTGPDGPIIVGQVLASSKSKPTHIFCIHWSFFCLFYERSMDSTAIGHNYIH